MRLCRTLRVRGSKGEADVKALFDTSASFSVIRRDVAERISDILPTGVRDVILADGKTTLRVLGYVALSTIIEGSPVDDIAYVVEGLAEELVIGVKVMEFYEIKLDPAKDKLTVGKNYTSFDLYALVERTQLKHPDSCSEG